MKFCFLALLLSLGVGAAASNCSAQGLDKSPNDLVRPEPRTLEAPDLAKIGGDLDELKLDLEMVIVKIDICKLDLLTIQFDRGMDKLGKFSIEEARVAGENKVLQELDEYKQNLKRERRELQAKLNNMVERIEGRKMIKGNQNEERNTLETGQ